MIPTPKEKNALIQGDPRTVISVREHEVVPPDPALDTFWRNHVADRCGGSRFDEPGGGYSFSAVLAEERELVSGNRPGDPSSALLTLSVADPTHKMLYDAFVAGSRYFNASPDASRYTDLAGIRAGNGTDLGDTQQEISYYLVKRYPGLANQITPNWIQYLSGSIKRALSEYIPAAFFSGVANSSGQWGTQLLFPAPGYGVITNEINKRGADVTEIPLEFHQADRRWHLPFPGDFQQPNRSPVLYLNVPHNPTGMTFDQKYWQGLLLWAEQANAIVVVDEAYTDLCFRPDACSVMTIPGWERRCIVLQSVSKGWDATGLRFGWVIAHPTAIKALRKVMDVKDSGTFGPTIAMGLTCLRHPIWTEQAKQRYESLHRQLNTVLNQAGFAAPMPEAGLCQLARAPRRVNDYEFSSIVDCVQWFRQKLRISVMHYELGTSWWFRFAVTLTPVPECGLPTESSIIAEVGRRLTDQAVKFRF